MGRGEEGGAWLVSRERYTPGMAAAAAAAAGGGCGGGGVEVVVAVVVIPRHFFGLSFAAWGFYSLSGVLFLPGKPDGS